MSSKQEYDYIDLGVLAVDIWKGIKKFWLLILLCIILGAAGMWGYQYLSYQPLYMATSSFTVKTTGVENEVNTAYGFYYDKNTADQIEKTFPYILSSGILQKKLCEAMDTTYVNGSISAQVIEDSNLVTLSVTSESKPEALEILESVILVYPDVAEYVLGEIDFEYFNEPELQDQPINRPSTKKSLAYGGFGGLVASLALVFLYALTRKTIRTEEDLKQLLNTAFLGMVPEVKEKKILITEKWKKKSRYQEDIYSLQNRVEYQMEQNHQKVLLVTSTEPAEGKTTLAVNLALAMAQRGKKVLLIDGDLRKSDVQKKIGYQYNEVTMTEYFRDNVPFENAVQYLEEEGLYVLGCGKPIYSAISVVTSSQMRKLMEQARAFADVVIVDAPPYGMLADAGHFYEYVDGVLMVIRQDWVKGSKVMDTVLDFPGQGEKLIGCVLNMVKTGFTSYGYGYSSYGYGYSGYYHYKEK